jgi:hypothetical protein
MNASPSVRCLTPLLLLVLLSLGSCVLEERRGGEVCFDSADCTTEEGQLEACIAARCVEVGCLSSADCEIGTICDTESGDYRCEAGCQSDSDCLAGFDCQEGSCVQYGCRTTLLDCGFGEVCNPDNGACEPSTGPHCTECTLSNNTWDDGGTTTTCDDVLLASDECGGHGSFCMNWYEGRAVCYVGCTEQSECPGGYQCNLVVRPLPSGCADDYIILGTACQAPCP